MELSGKSFVVIGALGARGAAVVAGAKSASARIACIDMAPVSKESGKAVNVVLPSIIDTPSNRAAVPSADFERWVRPEQVADLIVFLLSERATAITGAAIPIAGRV
jgi:enoyl-[acyl-carrier-protein] reductase (NADH)